MQIGAIEAVARTYRELQIGQGAVQQRLELLVLLVLLLVFTAYNYQWMPAVIFVFYLIYGFVRPWLPRKLRRAIESAPAAPPEGTAAPEEGDARYSS